MEVAWEVAVRAVGVGLRGEEAPLEEVAGERPESSKGDLRWAARRGMEAGCSCSWTRRATGRDAKVEGSTRPCRCWLWRGREEALQAAKGRSGQSVGHGGCSGCMWLRDREKLRAQEIRSLDK